jgi:teichuronic acid biosynthesis glycosyltransferase TuaG
MAPKVSVIIPFYNCSYINQAIQSVLNQTYKNIEIIVVDDGSTLFTEKLDPYCKEIKYIRKENGGTATALNLGIRTATGEYFAWLSSDDWFLPEKISKQMNFMLNNKVEASFTNYDYIDKDNNILLPFIGKRFSSVKEIYLEFLNVNPVNGCTVIMKKEIFDHIGYFNSDLRFTHDYDMWFRLLLNGYQMHYLDESLTRFRSHKKSSTQKFQPQIKKEINAVKSYHHPRLREYIKHLN